MIPSYHTCIIFVIYSIYISKHRFSRPMDGGYICNVHVPRNVSRGWGSGIVVIVYMSVVAAGRFAFRNGSVWHTSCPGKERADLRPCPTSGIACPCNTRAAYLYRLSIRPAVGLLARLLAMHPACHALYRSSYGTFLASANRMPRPYPPVYPTSGTSTGIPLGYATRMPRPYPSIYPTSGRVSGTVLSSRWGYTLGNGRAI